MSKSNPTTILHKISVLQIDLSGGLAGITFEYFHERPDQNVEHDDIVL